MKKFKYILYIIVAFTLASCADKLELEPQQSISDVVALSTESNIQNVLIGVYEEISQSDGYGGRLQMIADLLGSGDITTWAGTFIQPRNIKNKTILATNSFVGNFWTNSYESINQANLVLDNLDKVTSSSDAKNTIEGEAKFLRALSYFDLVRHFSSGSIGVPLRTEGVTDYSQDLSIARSDASAIYDLVASDLQSAVSLLPETNDFWADKYSAQALLARVYLQQGNFAGALSAADAVIQNSGHSLNSSFAAAFNNDSNSSEDLFSFQVTSQTGDNQLNNFYADEGNGGRGGDIVINDAYIAMFDDPNDERASFFYASGQSGERLTSKYMNQFGNIPLIRLAEMYLIRAEANVMLGSEVGDSPLNDLNTIRARSGAAPLDGDVTREMVLNERILELAFEGFAKHDIVRTMGSVDGFSYDAPELVLPIPQNEMDTNSSMQQNPGYN